MWYFLNRLGNYLLIFDCDLRAVCAVRASYCFRFFLLVVKLRRLVRLYIHDALVVASCFGTYWLALCNPLFRRTSNSDAFSVIDVLLGGLDDLVGDGFLHKVHLALSYYLHELVLQRNDQLLIPLILGCVLVATSQSLQPSCASALSDECALARFDGGMHQERVVLV